MQCNRCGNLAPHWVELGQQGLAFVRNYCDDPDDGRVCWDWIVEFQKLVLGVDIRSWGVKRRALW